jgi:hypothetical protein
METSALLVAALMAPSEVETAVDMELALARWVCKTGSIRSAAASLGVFGSGKTNIPEEHQNHTSMFTCK